MIQIHKARSLITIHGMNLATKSAVESVIEKNPDCIIQTSLSWEQRSKAAMLLELGFIGTGWAKRKEREYSLKVQAFFYTGEEYSTAYSREAQPYHRHGGTYGCCAITKLILKASDKDVLRLLRKTISETRNTNKSILLVGTGSIKHRRHLDKLGFKHVAGDKLRIYSLRVNRTDKPGG